MRGARTASTAARGLRQRSFRELAESFLRLLNVFEREFAGSNQMRHDWPRAAAEEAQKLVDKAALSLRSGDCSLENVGIADPLGNAHGLLRLKPVGGGLDGGVCGALRFGKGLQDLADRARAFGPESLHDLKFESGESGRCHAIHYFSGK